MPTYTFKHIDTGVVETHLLRISELDQFKADNPNLSQIIGSPELVRSVNKKPDSGFRDVLKSIKKASGRGANINTFD